MSNFVRTVRSVRRRASSFIGRQKHALSVVLLAPALLFLTSTTSAQIVTTQHYDNTRSGSNTSETILTTSSVTPTTFGRLFSQSVDAQIYAQPLYMQNVTISGKAAHNVVFVATENDSVYAFDADTNGGTNATPLWKVTLLDSAHGAASGATSIPQGDVSTTDITPIIGITGTPVIDPSSNTMYLVSATKEGGNYFQRLHALDITSGAEKFGGPVPLSGSVPGNGNGSSGGTLTFDQKWENNRPGLLLLNGIVYIGFAAHGDNGPWHGWILAYNASTLKQTSVWCSSANGIGAGIWMSGSGIAADTLNPTGKSPGGRLFVATGNGTFDATTPYTNTMDYGDSIVRLHLNNGVMTVADDFTPLNQATLNGADEDVASGGVLVLPDQSGSHTHLLFQTGKEGRFYIVDRDNMGGHSTSSDNIAQEIPVNGASGSFPIPAGIWGMPAFFNNTMYIWGKNDKLKTFPMSTGKIPTSASSTGTISIGFPSPTPVISSNAGASPIVWSIESDNFNSGTSAVLRATDATNIGSTLYDSSANSNDNPGAAVKFTVPTVANGKVYVGTANQLSIFGLSNGQSRAATPVINPGAESFVGSIQVKITDSTPGAQIFYSTTGTATTASTPYTGAITVSTTETISAIATATGFLQSAANNETYTLQTQTLMPTFSPAPGNYTSAQTVTISDASPNPTIYYAINAPATTSSVKAVGSATVSVSQTETINAIATSGSLSTSPQASASYGIGVAAGSAPNFPVGFSSSASVMTFNGSTTLDDTRLQLTSGATNQAGSAWFNTPQNIQNFTNDFTFQLSNPSADGMTFTIQNTGLTALGPAGGGLGYGPSDPGGATGIGKSIAIKFDLYDNDGEGNNSTGLYTNGASPTVPATNLTPSNINLHSGDEFSVHMVYNGTTLSMTITDGVTGAIFTTSWTVNISSIVGGNTAYLGFTGGTGGLSSSQKIENWTFVGTSTTQQQASAPLFSPAPGTYTGTQSITLTDATPGSTIFYTTNGSTPATTAGGSTLQFSATNPISVAASETLKALAAAPGFTTSAVSSAAYTINALQAAPTPTISPVTGTYTAAQTITITDPGATIYYTIDGSAPSTNSTKYTASFVANATTTVRAIGVESGFSNSAIAQSVITISSGTTGAAINFGSGFTAAGMQFNGHTKLNGTRLQLTDTIAQNESASAFWTTPVNVQSFTNDFTFQLTSPTADGFTFTIQNTGITALGPAGGGLGYGPDSTAGTPGIGKSVAAKFDMYNNAGEGPNSTGLYTNGASPTTPATTIGGNVSLHSGDILKAHMTYDGTTLTLTLTDTTNTAETFTTSWPVNIPSIVGGNTAFVGFTAGTGGSTATQEILTWTYAGSGTTTAPKTPVVYQTANLPATSSGPTFRQFTYASFPDTTGTILDATAAGQSVTMTLNVATAGTYDVKISTKELNTRGIFQLAINGASVGAPQDEYNGSNSAGVYATLDLGNFNFAAAGTYSFKFTVTSKNASSTGFSIAFDDITLTPQ
ncbi:MAG TPA: chitobiase/beta-hexosaminidase C-terminal domain-containing protein [Candidatus Sulfotelmatobacter sp.]|nr:chitobiase/beta-hexosaminidase C-terminal domain-containing protein [Candidatus Sulfotelmatobacter sp.]